MQEKTKDGKYIGNIRHYTVSNAMAEDQYNDYCKVLESHVRDKENREKNGDNHEKVLRLEQSLYSLANSKNFSLTVKAYWDARGLSARMFEASMARDNTEWMMKGPMGKSLGVKRNG